MLKSLLYTLSKRFPTCSALSNEYSLESNILELLNDGIFRSSNLRLCPLLMIDQFLIDNQFFDTLFKINTNTLRIPLLLKYELIYLDSLANLNFSYFKLLAYNRKVDNFKKNLRPVFDQDLLNSQLNIFNIEVKTDQLFEYYISYLLYTDFKPFAVDDHTLADACWNNTYQAIFHTHVNVFDYLLSENKKNISTIAAKTDEFPRGIKYMEKYWPSITNPQGIHNQDMYRNLILPNVRVESVNTHSTANLYIVLHSIDVEITFGGMSAFYEFIITLSRHSFNAKLNIVLTDQSSGLKGAHYQINRTDHYLFKNKSGIEIDSIQLFNSWNDNQLTIHFNSTLVAYNGKAAYLCNEIKKQIDVDHFYYFIQEDESIFHPHDSINAAIKESYKLADKKIINSSMLFSYMSKSYPNYFNKGSDIVIFQHQYMSPDSNIRFKDKKNQVIVYFRPEAHASRNCPEIILEAIREWYNQFASKHKDCFAFIGLGAMADYSIKIDDNCELRAIEKMSYEDYIQTLKESAVGISLMNAPHPSVVPFEMAEFGVRCVTNTFINRNATDLKGLSPYIYPTSLDPAEIAIQLDKAIDHFIKDASSAEVLPKGSGNVNINTKWNVEFSQLLVDLLN